MNVRRGAALLTVLALTAAAPAVAVASPASAREVPTIEPTEPGLLAGDPPAALVEEPVTLEPVDPGAPTTLDPSTDPTTLDPPPSDPPPTDPPPTDPPPSDPPPSDPPPSDPPPSDPPPVDPPLVDGPWIEDDPPCTGVDVTDTLVTIDPNGTTFDVSLSTFCVSESPLPSNGTASGWGRLIGPNLDLGVTGTFTWENGNLVSLDVSGWGSYDAANLGVQGTVRLSGDIDGASLTVSGALRANGSLVTGDVTASLHLVDGRYVLDASGTVNWWKGKLNVSGTFVTVLSRAAELPPGTDPLADVIGSLRVDGTASFGAMHGDVDVLLSLSAPGGPLIFDLTLTDVVLAGEFGIDRLTLGNTAALPSSFPIDVQLKVPKLIDRSRSLHAAGTIDLTTGNFDLAFVGAFRTEPLLGWLYTANTGTDLRISGQDGQVVLYGAVTAGLAVPLLATGGGGIATLYATVDANSGALSATLDFQAAACIIGCFLASASGQFHATVTGNVSEGWADVSANGSAGGSALFGLVASGSGWARLDGHFDFSGPQLMITGTAAYAVEVNTWLGMTHNVDDWMEISFEGNYARIVDGQWRRRREKVVNLRGDVWPVLRQCGDRYTKHRIDFDGWDYQGKWGDCDGNGNVQLATVNGRLVQDVDRSFSETPADTGLVEQRVRFERNGEVIGTAYTDANGNFSARVTSGGMASMVIDPMPADMDYSFGQYSGVIVTSGQTATMPTVGLAAHQFGTLTGVAFHDVDQDGVLDPGEPLLPGAGVTLTSSAGPERTTTTDATGRWTVSGLTAGEFWSIAYTAPSGYWFRDDPYAVGEDRATTLVWTGAPREVAPIGVVNVDIPVPGEVLTGHVVQDLPWPFSDVPLADRYVQLDDGHVARTDSAGNFRVIGLTPGVRTWTVWTAWPVNVTGTVDIVAGGPNHIEVRSVG